MRKTIWKYIKGFSDYQIDNTGRIKSFKLGKIRILKPITNNHGYLRIELYKNKVAKAFSVHRLVSEAFIPNPENKPQVNHKDGNKLNNNVENLEWVTNNENYSHSVIKNLVSSHPKRVLCIEMNKVFTSITEASRILNIDRSNIKQVILGKRKSARGLTFKKF